MSTSCVYCFLMMSLSPEPDGALIYVRSYLAVWIAWKFGRDQGPAQTPERRIERPADPLSPVGLHQQISSNGDHKHSPAPPNIRSPSRLRCCRVGRRPSHPLGGICRLRLRHDARGSDFHIAHAVLDMGAVVDESVHDSIGVHVGVQSRQDLCQCRQGE